MLMQRTSYIYIYTIVVLCLYIMVLNIRGSAQSLVTMTD
jgi:hypothetical protein